MTYEELAEQARGKDAGDGKDGFIHVAVPFISFTAYIVAEE